MQTWNVQVQVWLKESVFDPQGNAVEQTFRTLGYEGVGAVRIGKSMSFTVTASDEAQARGKVEAVCDAVLCNPVMETYAYELTPVEAGVTA